MADSSTIFALSSGAGKAGIAVIRVSGPAVRAVMGSMAAPAVLDRQAAFRRIVHPRSRALLDRAVVVFFASPRSETSEDVVEFQVHGGRAVVRAVLDALAHVPGCRMAEPGEFARRAFNNGKLDLAEVESLADLVDAETEAQRKLALQTGGMLSALYEGWRAKLIEVAGLVEAAIDFSDEGDVGTKAFEAARVRARPLREAIAKHLDDGHRGEMLREGFRVALLGPPNAGKSSLLNALARRDAAIVSEEAGTTRDVIEVRLDLDGYPVIVSDTAGIRETEGRIEQEGIRRSLAAARAADLNLWLSETGNESSPSEISRETLVMVRTKLDLGTSPSPLGERVGV
ncbi:MAG: tRNA uridine-5-carboxymethylaminomethyl(34) synthesis GTPase MnmE, partial [Hyphomicrobium sp.]